MAGRQWASLLGRELRHLAAFNASDRRWQMPLFAALASGLPLLIGAWFDRFDYGLISSMGGLVFLYTPNTPLYHRMVSLMACAFGMSACYALGLRSHFLPWIWVPVLGFIAIVVTMVCRFYLVGPPGSLFFVMAASIGAYSPIEVMQVPLHVGLLTMGCVLACLIAFFYSLYIIRLVAPQPVTPLPPASFEFVVFDSVVIGTCVGIALGLAQALQLERAYWVPVSCLAVIFVTPLTIFLAEATQIGTRAPELILEARLLDTVLGSLVGLLGGACLHSPSFRERAGRQVRRLIPLRLLP